VHSLQKASQLHSPPQSKYHALKKNNSLQKKFDSELLKRFDQAKHPENEAKLNTDRTFDKQRGFESQDFFNKLTIFDSSKAA
jgi:hypothetical protein